MASKLLAVLVMSTMALAGCSGDKDTGPTPEELCQGIWTGDACMPHIEPHVMVDGLDDQVTAYQSESFTWSLMNGTRGDPSHPVHSMDSRIVAIVDGTVPTNATEPDGVGTLIAQQEHKNLPDNFTATFTWSTVGDQVSLWGYMRIDGVHTWNQVGNVSVVAPEPTGVTKTVTFSQGPPPGASPTEMTLNLGDALNFENQNALYGYDVAFSCNQGFTVDGFNVGAGSTSAAITFLQPTGCSWTATSPLTSAGQGDLSGRVTVIA